MKISKVIEKAKIISEAPIQDLDHVGDFSKSSSFRDERDRRIITHPASIVNIKKKFGSVKQNINILFVNTPKANKFTELGRVELPWIEDELGEEVLNKIKSMNTDNAITIIFTNNKGAQRVPMTPWIMAHRMMHVFARGSDKKYKDAANEITRFTADYVLPAYLGYDRKVPDSYDEYLYGRNKNRNMQLLFKHLFHEIGTFKSARDKKIRDWFEVINELGAQYIITGSVKFNEAPKCIGTRNNRHCVDDDMMMDQANDAINSMGYYFDMKMDYLLDDCVGKIFLM